MPAAPAERSAGAARVLLVDDDPSVLDTLAAILRTGGYEVLPVATAQAAIEALRRQTIDALVVDLRLSGQDDGLTILSAAVREQPDVVGIVLTGYGTLESAIQTLDAGAFSYLLKPCNPDQLQAAVLRGLEKRATARALVELQHAVARAVEDRAEAQLRDAESREAEAREAAARSSRRLSQLQSITGQLAHYTEPQPLLEQIVRVAAQMLDSPIAAVFLLTRPEADFECAAAEGLEISGSVRLPRHRSLASQAVAQHTTLAVDDVRSTPGIALPRLAGGKYVGSLIVAPIWEGANPLGAIEVYRPTVHHWPDDDIALLSALAAVAGVALVGARLQEDVQKANRTRDEVLASITHDLKTPLTTISGVSQLLQRRTGDADQELLSGLETIHQMSRNMASLIDHLMDTARLQYGQQLERQLGRVDLVASARDVVKQFQTNAPNHQIVLEAPESLVGEWDDARLRRVLENLLSNAIKYSPRGGRVIVRVGRDGDRAAVSVQDFGLGIGPEDLPQLFEPFRRGRNVEGIAGSGLGLLSVKRIVELHGGNVSVDSVKDAGSTFAISLPLKPPARTFR